MLQTTRNVAQKYGVKLAVATLAAPFALTNAFAAGELTAGVDSVDLAGVATKVAAIALLIVGIAMAFKSPDLAKRAVRKV